LYSSTDATNLQFLQNKTSLLTKFLIDVGIFPQYKVLFSQLGHDAKSLFIPNSFFRFMCNLVVSDILASGSNCTSANFKN